MSFTTGGLFHRESVELAALYRDSGDWTAVRAQVIGQNLLQSRTQSTLKRVCREIIGRLKTLSGREIEYLVAGSSAEQARLLWIAVCRRYRFIGEFAVEVMRERRLAFLLDLRHEDFDAFFDRKAEWNTQLDEIKPGTRRKLRQVLFRMLQEAGILTASHTMTGVLLTSGLLKALHPDRRDDVVFFPVYEVNAGGAPQ